MAGAHPHAFVECNFSFVMDKEGLVGFRQKWVLDEMTTLSILDVVDADRNGALSTEEKAAVRNLTEESLSTYHYFTVAVHAMFSFYMTDSRLDGSPWFHLHSTSGA
jgi:ABC-type uncharacterized transport system substrate-binding protein